MIEEYRQAKKNPYDLFDPSKHDYLGRPEVLSGFQKTIQQSMKDFADRLHSQSNALPDVLPKEQLRRPGETFDQWKKRTGN